MTSTPETKARTTARNRAYVRSYLLTHPCVDCGEPDPIVLHFDHVDPSTKHKTICKMVKQQASLATIQAEIEKCEVRYANCHMRRSAQQFGWWSVQKPSVGGP